MTIKINKIGNEKKYIIFQPPDNIEVQKTIKAWLSEADGSLPLKEIESKCNEVFHFYYPQIYTEEQMNKNSPIGSWRKFAFRVDDGIVYED